MGVHWGSCDSARRIEKAQIPCGAKGSIRNVLGGTIHNALGGYLFEQLSMSLSMHQLNLLILWHYEDEIHPQTPTPSKSTVCANTFGKVCTNSSPFSCTMSRKQAERVHADRSYKIFFGVGGFLGCRRAPDYASN